MTMGLLDLQKSLRLLGKLRLGEMKKTAGGKTYPSKLAQWRMTSPSFELLEAAAAIYGGTVETWEGAPSEGRQYQIFTESDRLQVVMPADNALIQAYEMWNAGGAVRRCSGTGQIEELSGQACMCPVDQDERAALAAKGKACKITSRLKVLLPDIPDIGVWMLESHGYYAAVELAGFEEIMAMATVRGAMIPAQLRIDQRTAKRNGETRRYAVPVLELVTVTAHQLARGEVAALGSAAPALGSGGPSAARVLDAPRVPARTDAPESRATSNGGPPLPPLPHEAVEVPDAPPSGASGVGGVSAGEDRPPASDPADTTRLVNRVAIACREAGLDDDGRHQLCGWASLSRETSSKLLTEGEQALVVDAARRIGAGTATLVDDGDGGLVLRDTRFGWPAVTPTAEGVGVLVPLDELRTVLRARLEALAEEGKAGWKAAGLPALTKLAEEHRELALATVWKLEGEPF